MTELHKYINKQEEPQQQKLHIKGSSVVAVILIALVLSLIISTPLALRMATKKLNDNSLELMDEVHNVVDSYEHAFLLLEQLILQELRLTSEPDEIESYLKSMDKRLLSIEGEDYDGIYLYYKDRYLYSWDTPYSVYEEGGYDATTRPWYLGAAAAGGAVYVTEPYASYANDYMLATLSRMQSDGETVIAYDIKMRSLQRVIGMTHISGIADIFLCHENGNIISSTDPVYLGENYNLSQEQLQENVNAARLEMEKVQGTDKTERAQKAYNAAEQTLKLKLKYGGIFEKTTQRPNVLCFDLQSRSFAYQYKDEVYTCVFILSFKDFVFMEGTVFLISFFVLVAIGVIVESEIIRRRHIKMMQKSQFSMKQALAAADTANNAKSQFLAQMSHEIRTPMNAVIGLAALAKTDINNPEKVEEYLSKIEGSSKILLGIINDVLDMSSIAGGKMKIGKAPFNFKYLITNLASVFYLQAEAKNITFRVSLTGITEEILVGDELRLNQILMNLLSNAIKFTPSGGEVNLSVVQQVCAEAKVSLRFSVSDTGCGISEDMMGRIFLPFEQESATTARKHGGSGLGLSITKNLVELMEGKISVESTQGKGSVFTVELCFDVPESITGTKITEFSSIRALIVDSDSESCENSRLLFTHAKVRCDCVADEEAALAALGYAEDVNDPYSLCLINWETPELNGAEIVKHIKVIFGRDSLPIVALTYNSRQTERKVTAEGASFLVTQPLFRSELYNVLAIIAGDEGQQIFASPERSSYNFEGKKVLLVEDVALNMEVAAKLLQRVGIQVTCAEDGKQAIKLYNSFPAGTFDCILMDVNMPIMDGYEATRQIRKSEREDAGTIPIYAMTANAFSADVANALNAGMSGHIAKPIEVDVLYDTLKNVFGPGK